MSELKVLCLQSVSLNFVGNIFINICVCAVGGRPTFSTLTQIISKTFNLTFRIINFKIIMESEDYSQFKYLEIYGDTVLRKLASEQLLKEIGVDLQKFLSTHENSDDKLISQTLKSNSNKQSSYSNGFNLPPLSSLNSQKCESTQNSTFQQLDLKFKRLQMKDKYMPTDDEVEQYRESHQKRMLAIEQRFQNTNI